MWSRDFLYQVAVVFDVAALGAVVIAPIVGLVTIIRSGWQRARSTFAYLGYVCCAFLAASFALHFALDGGDIFMMFVFWLVPFAVAATVAMLMTLVIDSSRGLWTLAAATILLGLLQLVAEFSPGGIGGVVAVLLLAAYFVYAIVVLVVTVQRRSEWWSPARGEA